MIARAVPLLAVLACAPDSVTIGTTDWAVPVPGSTVGRPRIGPAGHIALQTYEAHLLFAPDGRLLWSAPCGDDCELPGIEMEIDQAGNLYILTSRFEAQEVELVKLRAADGAVEWRLDFAWDAPRPGLLFDGAGDLWLLVDASGPTDFGGGPVGGPDLETRWARFDRDGEHLASGALGLRAGACRAAWPDRPGLILTGSGCQGMFAIDAGGAVVWSEERDPETLVATHAGGELTMLSPTPPELIRLDAERRERWRVGVGPFGLSEAAPVAGGGLLVDQFEGLGVSSDVSYLQQVSAGGELSEREYFAAAAKLAEGAPLAGYAFVSEGQLFRRSLP